MENFEYDNKNVVALISEMEQAGKYFENYAPAVCLKARGSHEANGEPHFIFGDLH
jgi:hypothetical protein